MANNWTETCAKCMEGDIEPRHCEYYGEPNGCNSPIYGEHPSTLNAAAMRSCLLKILAEMIDLGGMERGRKACFSPDAIADEIRQALYAPPRNCERFRNADEALEALERHCNSSGNGCVRCPVAGCSIEDVECKIAWLFAPAMKKKGDNDGE